MTRRQWLVVLSVCLFLWVSAVAAEDDYVIKIDRARHVGDTGTIVADGESTTTQTITLDGQVIQTKKVRMQVHVEAAAKVLTVGTRGQTTKAQYAIRKFEGTLGDAKVDPPAEGQVVIVQAEGDKTIYTPAQGELSEPVRTLLRLVLDVGKEDDRDNDVAYGTSRRQKVGGEWKINPEAVAASLTRHGLKARPDDVSGSQTLVEVRQVQDTPCLHVKGQVEVKAVVPPMPPTAKLTQAKASVTMEGDFPVDTAVPSLSQASSVTMDVQFDVTDKDGNTPHVSVVNVRTLQIKITPQKAGN